PCRRPRRWRADAGERGARPEHPRPRNGHPRTREAHTMTIRLGSRTLRMAALALLSVGAACAPVPAQALGAASTVDPRIRLDWQVGAARGGRWVIQGYVYKRLRAPGLGRAPAGGDARPVRAGHRAARR